jgi:hypothetical protein
MSRDEDDKRLYRFGPLERRGVIGGLRLGQAMWLGGGCVLAVILLRVLPGAQGVPAAVVTILVAGLAAIAPVYGRNADEWLPVIGGMLAVRLRGEHHYRAGRAREGFHSSLDGSEMQRPPAMPPQLRGCRLLSAQLADGSEIGMLHDSDLGAYTAVVALRARAVSLLPASEHERRLDHWGQLLAATARRGSAIRRLQVIEHTAPADGDVLTRYFESARVASAPDETVRSYEELVETATRVIQEHEVLLAVQVDERRAWARAARESRGARSRDEQAGIVLVSELRALTALLQRLEVTIVGLLSPSHFAAALRLAFDPFTERASDDALGPEALDAGWNTLHTDGAWHRTYWISQWPRLPVGPVFLTPLLLGTQAVRTVSIVIEPVAPHRSRRAVEAAVTSDEADDVRREAKGFRRTARQRRQREATQQREDELASGHEELRFAGYVTVSARDRDELLRACEEIEQAAQQSWLELTPCWGEQDVAFAQSALPIGRGLRKPRALGGS